MEHSAKDEVTRDFKGNTWHNMGVAYTRLMNFKSAQECFLKAWRLNKNEASLKSLLWTSKLLGDETRFFDAVENSGLDEDKVGELVEVFDRVEADSKSSKNDRQKLILDMCEDKSKEGYLTKRKSYLAGLKEWYRG